MIVVRAPLRITLGGGGTDLPSYYEQRGEGFCLGATIQNYVYIAVSRHFSSHVIFKYSQTEVVDYADDFRHPLIREAIRLVAGSGCGLEFASFADLPKGSGLGSSSCFVTALLLALKTLKGQEVCARELAELACRVELEILKEPIGKQDQWAIAHGGVNSMKFRPDEIVVSPIKMHKTVLATLQERLWLVFTGLERSASESLLIQHQRSVLRDAAMMANLDRVKAIGQQSCLALERGDLWQFGQLLNEQHELKCQRTTTPDRIVSIRNYGLKNGAQGARLLGAGGGGFLMFYTEDPAQFLLKMAKLNLPVQPVQFDFEGPKILCHEKRF